MSRIGKKPIIIPKDVEVKIDSDLIAVKGPKGEVNQKIHPHVNIMREEDQIMIKVQNPKLKEDRALWGLYGSLINNMIIGVTQGFEKKLEVIGVGYKAVLSGNKLILSVGYSHPVEVVLPQNISVTVDKNIITISGCDKQLVGEIAARVRKIRPPEPYKGTGIKYVNEVIRKKVGKAAKATGGKT